MERLKKIAKAGLLQSNLLKRAEPNQQNEKKADDVYRNVNLVSFQKNFQVLIAHFKKENSGPFMIKRTPINS